MHSIRRGQRRRRNNERRGGKRVRRRPPIREHVVAAHVINERAFWDTTAATTGMAPRIVAFFQALGAFLKRIKESNLRLEGHTALGELQIGCGTGGASHNAFMNLQLAGDAR